MNFMNFIVLNYYFICFKKINSLIYSIKFQSMYYSEYFLKLVNYYYPYKINFYLILNILIILF